MNHKKYFRPYEIILLNLASFELTIKQRSQGENPRQPTTLITLVVTSLSTYYPYR